jgi:late competence protein required for DNA uptake (superfamily II DNA/RNA helicase)
MDTPLSGFIETLPVFDYYSRITEAVDNNQVTIITAETGAGKSTQVPQYLLEHGYDKIVVTQPRILAARNLSRRVREEWTIHMKVDNDQIIGYRTAHERDDTENTKILYCTDGLQLVREITGAGVSNRQVLVLDEVHEWNENMEVLVAWAKKRCQEDPHFKVVIMSATIETESLAAYFNTTAVITIPGRSFEVTKRKGTDVVSEITAQLTTGQANVLVFLPGKAEIQDTMDTLLKQAKSAGVPLIPLHGQLEASAQQQAFASYPNGKIILSTNIAQTSVTIDDIDVVIDSGLERRSEVRSGVEGLFIAQISQADCLQRAGRAGRTKKGEYILAPYESLPCLDFDDRPAYATPEILRKHIDRLTLRLASIGIDIEQLDFYHDPSQKAIAQAKHTLISLGALTRDNTITGIGKKMEHFPVESSYGRMLVESEQYSNDIQTKLAAIIGIQEVGGIVKGGTKYTGWRRFTNQTKSDLLAQYDVYLAVPQLLPEELEDAGIISKNVTKAKEVMERLDSELRLGMETLVPIEESDEEPLLKSIISGQIDQLWVVDEFNDAVHIQTKRHRELSSSTVVRNPRFIAGTPFDLQIPTRSGAFETLHLVQGITVVNTEWLVALAPDLFSDRRNKKLYYDPRTGYLAKRQSVQFGKQIIEGSGIPVLENSPQNRRAFADNFSKWAYDQLEYERRRLGGSHSKRIPSIPLRTIQHQVQRIGSGIIALDQLNPKSRMEMISLSKLQTHLGKDYMVKLGRSFRGEEPRPEKRRYGWSRKNRKDS